MSNSHDLSTVLEAVSFAARKHQGQFRKDGSTPYAAHPLRVMTILMRQFNVRDVETLAAAALHDVIEDTGTDFDEVAEQFGERVARFVAFLSKDARLPEHDREPAYREALAAAPVEVKLCKLGDMYDNLSDCANISDRFRARTVRKMRQYLESLERDFPAEWRHAVEMVRERIDEADDSR